MNKGFGVLIAAAILTSACAGVSEREEQLSRNIEKQIGAGLPSFQELDGDNSGYLNKDEAKQRESLAEEWAEWDEDHDGQINRSEFASFEREDLKERAKAVERAADRAEDRIDRAN